MEAVYTVIVDELVSNASVVIFTFRLYDDHPVRVLRTSWKNWHTRRGAFGNACFIVQNASGITFISQSVSGRADMRIRCVLFCGCSSLTLGEIILRDPFHADRF